MTKAQSVVGITCTQHRRLSFDEPVSLLRSLLGPLRVKLGSKGVSVTTGVTIRGRALDESLRVIWSEESQTPGSSHSVPVSGSEIESSMLGNRAQFGSTLW